MDTKVEILQYWLVSVTATWSMLLIVRAAVPVFLQTDASVKKLGAEETDNTENRHGQIVMT